MTKEDIEKINSFVSETTQLNVDLLTSDEKKTIISQDTSSAVKDAIVSKIQKKLKAAGNLQIRIEGFFRAVVGETSTYITEIKQINFVLVEVSDHNKYSNELWLSSIEKLLAILEKAKFEFEEKLRIGNQQGSIRNFLQSNQARAIILTTLLSLLVGFFSKDYVYEFFGKVSWNKLGSAFPNFEVIELKRTVDLTEWTPTQTKNLEDQTGKAIFDDQYLIRKIRDEGKDFCITAGSSGSDPKFTSQTHSIKQTPIEMKLEGWPNLKNQALAILDVSKEKTNSSFKANFRSVRFNGFADTEANWCSVGIWHSTQKLIYHVDFPKNKMGNSFSFSTSFFYDRKNFQKLFPDNVHLTIDSTSVTWTVEHPTIGNAYRIDWNW